MSMLEKIIRPFSSVPFSPSSPAQPTRNIAPSSTVTIGGSGNMSPIQLHHSKHKEINEYIENYETKRTVDLVRVKNEEDDSQYVDIEVMKQLEYFDSVNNQNVQLNLSPPTGSANSEILQSDIVYNTDAKP